MADVFISYKREEIAWAARVGQALSEEGFSAFYDLDEDGIHAGEEWDKRLEKELADAKCCVVLWSSASTQSPNVRSEARRANDRGILVPAKINACQAPLGLDALQDADLRQWRGDRTDPQWRFLVDRGIARKVGRAGRPLKNAPRPPEPKAVSTPQTLAQGPNSTGVMLILAFAALLVSIPGQIMIADMMAIAEEFRLTGSQFDFIFQTHAIMAVLSVCFLGVLWRRSQPIQFRSLIVGFVLSGLGAAFASVAENFVQLLASRAVSGTGFGLLILSSLLVLSRSFPPSRLGLAFGALGAMVFLSQALAILLGSSVRIYGWREIFVLTGGIHLASALFLWRLTKPTTERLDSDSNPTEKFRASSALLAAIATHVAMISIAGHLLNKVSWGLPELFETKSAWTALATTVGMICGGWISDQLWRTVSAQIKLFIGISICTLLLLLLSVFTPNNAIATIATVSMGAAGGAWFGVCLALLYRANSSSERASMVSFGLMAAWFAGLVAPGVIFPAANNYFGFNLACVLFAAIGLLSVLLSMWTLSRSSALKAS
jgi:MFS family permease